MEVQQLNCASCGSPIQISDNADFVICPYCRAQLSVKRDENYAILKVVEQIGQVVQQSESATQAAIHDGTQVTQSELRRLETCTITVSSQLKDFLDWPYLEQVFKLERRFVSLETGEIQQQIEYGFTSLRREEITPLQLLNKTRSYWGIENGLHYRRDVTLREDYTRMTKGKAGQAMACLNNLVIGILLSKKKCRTIPTVRRYFNAHPAEALDLFLRL